MIVIYTNHCPLCNALEDLLNENNIEYEEETDVDAMLAMGIDRTPMLKVDDDLPPLTYKEALNWIKERK